MKIKYFCIFLLPFLLTGCWSANELNELTLITSMAIDKEEDGYLVTLAITVPSEATINAPGRSASTVVSSTKGINACDAFRKTSSKTSRTPNLSHIQNIIISEELAKEGILPAIDCVIRDDQLRPTSFLFIAKGVKAKDVLAINTSIEHSASSKITQMIKNAEVNYSIANAVSLVEFINSLTTPDKEAYLPGIGVYGDLEKGNTVDNSQDVAPSAIIYLAPYALFKKDKMIAWLDDYTSKGVNFLLNDVKSTMINYQCDNDRYFVLDVRKAKTKIKVNTKGKVPKFTISADIKGTICQADCRLDLTKTSKVKELENKFQRVIKQQLQKTMDGLLTNYTSDVLGLGGYIHRKDHKLWKNLNKDWEQVFKNLQYEIKVKVTIVQPGAIINPITNDDK